MNQQEVLHRIQAAYQRDDYDGMKAAYEAGLKVLPIMPKVHDSYAEILSQLGKLREAYNVIQVSISENSAKHEGIDGAESAYDLGLSHYNAVEILNRADWISKGKLLHHTANAVFFLHLAETRTDFDGLDRSERGWPNSPFGHFLPAYYSGELYMKRSFRDLINALNVTYSGFEIEFASLQSFIKSKYVMYRMRRALGDANSIGNAKQWLIQVIDVHIQDAMYAMKELESRIGIVNEKTRTIIVQDGDIIVKKVIDKLDVIRSTDRSFMSSFSKS
jgi:hypothetical protein